MSEQAEKSRMAGRLLWPLGLLVLCLGAASFIPLGSHRGRGSIPRPGTVKVADLHPNYLGRTVTWSEVKALQASGRASVIEIHSNDTGDYAFVFDNQTQDLAWQCATPEFHVPVAQCP